MGSIPVAGAIIKRSALVADRFIMHPHGEPTLRTAQNWVRIPRPKIDKLACQAQGEGIFARGEIPRNVVQRVIYSALAAGSFIMHPRGEPISASTAKRN